MKIGKVDNINNLITYSLLLEVYLVWLVDQSYWSREDKIWLHERTI
jgi:hypothetical protein